MQQTIHGSTSRFNPRSSHFIRKASIWLIRASDAIREGAHHAPDPIHQERLRHFADGVEQLAESTRPIVRALKSQEIDQ